ncbi:MAG: hypothetical protein JNL57_12900 [Bacteroidetes bacterium]|nr:hypothetical protein [Bacteroidota bacterium]
MPKFAVIKLEEVVGRVAFYKLSIDGECPFDEFWENATKDGNMQSELKRLSAMFQNFANGINLPGTKYHTLENIPHAAEFKTSHLRVYILQEKDTGKIIIMGGKKKNQKSDLKKLQKIVNQYLNR